MWRLPLVLLAIAPWGQDAPVVPEPARSAVVWVEAHPEQSFDVVSGEELIARVILTARAVTQGEQRFLELTLTRRSPAGAEFAEREVCWLRLDAELSPQVVRLFEASELAVQRAKVGLEQGKLTGTVRGRGLVRNVPSPLASEAGVLLRAALLPREPGARLRFTRLAFGPRGAIVEVDEALVFTGYEGEDAERVALVEHRAPRGKLRATYRFDSASSLVSYTTRGKDAVSWQPYEPPDEDDS